MVTSVWTPEEIKSDIRRKSRAVYLSLYKRGKQYFIFKHLIVYQILHFVDCCRELVGADIGSFATWTVIEIIQTSGGLLRSTLK